MLPMCVCVCVCVCVCTGSQPVIFLNYYFILFLAALRLDGCAFSSCSELSLSLVVVCWLLLLWLLLLQSMVPRGLSSCRSWAQWSCSMWGLPGAAIKYVSLRCRLTLNHSTTGEVLMY